MVWVEIAGFCVALLGCFAGGVVGGFIFEMVRERSFFSLAKRVQALENNASSALGVQARADNKLEMQAALIEAKAILDNKEMDQNAKMQAGLALLAKYPSCAGALMKMAGKIGL